MYYYGARYLDPRTSRWLSADPALGEYIPMAPVNDEAKKHNQNLPGMGGIYNTVNFHLYHYAGNNPVKYIDPTGESEQDYLVCEIYSTTIGLLTAGIPGALVGYKAVKDLEKYNGPDRDAANQAAIGNNPQNPKDNPNYVKLPDSEAAFHQLEDGSKVSKYVADKVDKNGGKSEIVWNDTKNELVADPKAKGTYNYGNGKIEHAIKDVIPWILLGTGKDDPSNMVQRAGDTLKAAPNFFKDLFNKKGM